MQPLKFEPILRTMVWGGSRLGPYKGLEGDIEHIGESWELSAFPGKVSVVSEGPLKGRDLTSLVKEYHAKLVGRKVYRESWYCSFSEFISDKDANRYCKAGRKGWSNEVAVCGSGITYERGQCQFPYERQNFILCRR